MRDNIGCLFCGNSLCLQPANTPSVDFVCEKCKEAYQVKSSSKPFRKRVLGAEYRVTLQAVEENRFPHLILVQYENKRVREVKVIHKAWITKECIIPRKKLSQNARRKGWQGCYIDLSFVPRIAKVFLIENGKPICAKVVREKWEMADTISFLAEKKGWTVSVWRKIEELPLRTFTLRDLYKFENEFQSVYPLNKHIREKIRQQIQILVDIGLINRIAPGQFCKADSL